MDVQNSELCNNLKIKLIQYTGVTCQPDTQFRAICPLIPAQYEFRGREKTMYYPPRDQMGLTSSSQAHLPDTRIKNKLIHGIPPKMGTMTVVHFNLCLSMAQDVVILLSPCKAEQKQAIWHFGSHPHYSLTVHLMVGI